MSKRILFCDNWRFHDGEIEVTPPAVKGPVYTQSKTESYRHGPAAIYYPDAPNDFGRGSSLLTHERWDFVNLPHDYMIDSPIDEHENNALGFRKYHPAWYRKHFKAEEGWKGCRIELEFLGIATECDIYMNGVWLRHNETQYTPIIVDITDFVRYGGSDNVIAVHVTQRTIENWWYTGGGICHKAYLNVSSPVSVERDGVYVAPVKLSETVRAIDHPVVGALYDPGNNIYATDEIPFPDGFAAIEGMIGHVHIKDAKRVNSETVATAVGEGAVDYKGIFATLKEIGYDGDIMLETHYRIAGEIDEKTLKNPKGSAISDGGYAPSCLCMENLLKLLGRD
jgi:hypothetical protein